MNVQENLCSMDSFLNQRKQNPQVCIPGKGIEENTTPAKIWCLRVAFQAIQHLLPYCLTCYILSVLILPF